MMFMILNNIMPMLSTIGMNVTVGTVVIIHVALPVNADPGCPGYLQSELLISLKTPMENATSGKRVTRKKPGEGSCPYTTSYYEPKHEN
jgi:hypothetical protein